MTLANKLYSGCEITVEWIGRKHHRVSVLDVATDLLSVGRGAAITYGYVHGELTCLLRTFIKRSAAPEHLLSRGENEDGPYGRPTAQYLKYL